MDLFGADFTKFNADYLPDGVLQSLFINLKVGNGETLNNVACSNAN